MKSTSKLLDGQKSITCQSFCHQCQATTSWQIHQYTFESGIKEFSRSHKITCERCHGPIEVQDSDLAAVETAVHGALINYSDTHLERAMQVQRRQEAFASTARMNWLEASQFN